MNEPAQECLTEKKKFYKTSLLVFRGTHFNVFVLLKNKNFRSGNMLVSGKAVPTSHKC